ncbi:MAG: CPBP family intramembrane metalloprotease [candidate division KSB1 bacterium]|nr:CPBP family intramembrane metalloprotease [candidate division KSB1 bacterium]
MVRRGRIYPRARRMPEPIGDYLARTRSLGYSFLAVLPLFMLYALLTLMVGDRPGSLLRYGADTILGEQTRIVRELGVVVLSVAAAIVFFAIGRGQLGRGFRRLKPAYFPLMMAEAAVLAILLGLGLDALPHMMIVASRGVADVPYEVMLAIGAGIFEELVFRLVLLGSLVFFFTRLRQFPIWAGYFLALLITSMAFAVAHYFQVRKASFDGQVFLLRQLAGVAFGIIYCLRGFGVAVYTHLWYDLFVTFA